MSDRIHHGTRSGFYAHNRIGDPPCNSCRVADRKYVREYRARGYHVREYRARGYHVREYRARGYHEHRGIPYGWWKSPDFWIWPLVVIPMLAMLLFILGTWFL